MPDEDVLSETEKLKAELAALRAEIAELRRESDMPDSAAALAQYDLTENERRALELIGLGLNQTEASRATHRHEDYVKNRLRESKVFAQAYSDIHAEFAKWQEARLRYVLPQVWREIDILLEVDPDEYVETYGWKYAQAMLGAKTKIIDKVLRLNYATESKIVMHHEVDIPVLQTAQENLGMIAEYMQKLALEDNEGRLKDRLPENQAIDLAPQEYTLKFEKQPRRESGESRCLECGIWVLNLGQHLNGKHNMSPRAYKAKWNLDPMEGIDVDPVNVESDEAD